MHRLWRVAASGGSPELVSGAGEDALAPALSFKSSQLAYIHEKTVTNIWSIPGPASATKATEPRRLTASTRDDIEPQLSPDGRRVAFTSDRSGNSEIYVSDSDGSNPMQLTSLGSSSTGTPDWSPDGQWIAFDSRAKGQPDIYVIGAQGGEPRQLTSGSGANYVPTWSRDGRWIYFTSDRSSSEQI